MLGLRNRGRLPYVVQEEFDHLISRLRGLFANLVDEDGNQLPDQDYEEGIWVPSLGGDTIYAERRGFYTRKGRQVTCHCLIYVNTIGTGSTAIVTGLPFQALQSGTMIYSGAIGYFYGAASSFYSVGCYVQPRDNTIVITGLTAAATEVHNPATFFGNNTAVHITITYPISAGL